MDITKLIIIPLAIVLLIPAFQIIDVLNQKAFDALDKSSTFLFPNITKLLLGIIGIVLVVGIIVSIFKPEPPQQYYYPEY